MESIRRGMKAEDDLARRTGEAYHRTLFGSEDTFSSGKDDDVLILGDVTTEHNYDRKQNGGLGLVGKSILMASILGSGVGLGIGLPSLFDKENAEIPKPPTTIVEPGEVRDWELGQPTVE